MTAVIDVRTPDGERHRHVTSWQNGRVEARQLADGSVEVVGVHETKEVRGSGGVVLRAATRREEVLGSYPAGSEVEHVGR